MLYLFQKKQNLNADTILAWQSVAAHETQRDKALCNKIAQLFEQDLRQNEAILGLHFYVQNGEITVKGTMSSESKKNEILRILSCLSSVKLIRDEIQVGFRPEYKVAR